SRKSTRFPILGKPWLPPLKPLEHSNISLIDQSPFSPIRYGLKSQSSGQEGFLTGHRLSPFRKVYTVSSNRFRDDYDWPSPNILPTSSYQARTYTMWMLLSRLSSGSMPAISANCSRENLSLKKGLGSGVLIRAVGGR